ncbi:hypothetical protein F5Y08DRAFT_29698 [Xylaria arbuscula]|nr:hypothetical protein F5Y08DRAFT_29698 [Xylaria arbuscula]
MFRARRPSPGLAPFRFRCRKLSSSVAGWHGTTSSNQRNPGSTCRSSSVADWPASKPPGKAWPLCRRTAESRNLTSHRWAAPSLAGHAASDTSYHQNHSRSRQQSKCYAASPAVASQTFWPASQSCIYGSLKYARLSQYTTYIRGSLCCGHLWLAHQQAGKGKKKFLSTIAWVGCHTHTLPADDYF